MMARQNKHFCVTLAISLALHLFVLTLLFTIPKADAPDGYKRVRVKLGTGRVKTADDMANARKYASYEPGAGLNNQKGINGNSDKDVAEIAEKPADAPPPKSAEEAKKVEASKPAPATNSSVEIPKTIISDDKKDAQVKSPKSHKAEVKKIEEKVAKKAVAKQPEKIIEKAEPQDSDDADFYDKDSTIIGNSIAPNAEKITSYEQMLPLWLEKFKKYPEDARALNASGVGEIFIKIDRKGKILLSKIIKTTGSPPLDKAIAKMMVDADPVLPVPPEYHPEKKTFSYKIAIEFERPQQ